MCNRVLFSGEIILQLFNVADNLHLVPQQYMSILDCCLCVALPRDLIMADSLQPLFMHCISCAYQSLSMQPILCSIGMLLR